MIRKGKISSLEGTTDVDGNHTQARITYGEIVSPPITIPWWLRGGLGNLQPQDEIAFSLFDDLTGIIWSRLDGEGGKEIPWDIIIKGGASVTGKVTASELTTDSVASYNSHVHGGIERGGGTTDAPR
jgi:hypothetical protein